MNNSFAVLQESESESESDCGGTFSTSVDKTEDNVNLSTAISRQSGGLITNRLLSKAGLNIDDNGCISVDGGFSDSDLLICKKVLESLNQNHELFRLASVKPIRAALQPLIEKFSSHNNTTSVKVEGRKTGRKRRKTSDSKASDEILQELEKTFSPPDAVLPQVFCASPCTDPLGSAGSGCRTRSTARRCSTRATTSKSPSSPWPLIS